MKFLYAFNCSLSAPPPAKKLVFKLQEGRAMYILFTVEFYQLKQ